MPDSSGPLIGGLADGGQEQSQQLIQAAIDTALRSLPEGESTGVCTVCGEAIEAGRLELIPGASDCADCAQKASRPLPLSNSN